MSFRTTSAFVALAGVAFTSTASASVIIDAFTDTFESEEFIFSAGSEINTIGEKPSLDAGLLLLPVGPDNDEVGEPNPGFTYRASETQTQNGLAGVLGGTRIGTITDLSDENSFGRSDAVIWGGFMSHNHGSGAGSTLELNYTNLDLAVGAGNFAIELVSGDMDQTNDDFDRPVALTLTVWSGSNSASLSDELLAVGNYTFDAQGFADQGVDLSNITRVDLFFDTDPHLAVDYSLQNFGFFGDVTRVPTPGSAALAGIAGLAAARRRRA